MLHYTHKVEGPYILKRKFNKEKSTSRSKSGQCHNDNKFNINEPDLDKRSLSYPKFIYPELMLLIGNDVLSDYSIEYV